MTPLDLDTLILKEIETRYKTVIINDYEIFVSHGLGVDVTIRRNDDYTLLVIHDAQSVGPENYIIQNDTHLLDLLDNLAMDDSDFRW